LNNIKYLVAALFTAAVMGVGELLWLKGIKQPPSLPLTSDLSLSTESHFIRHRSQTDLVEVFGMGPGLLPYFPSDFVYAPPPYLNAKDEIR